MNTQEHWESLYASKGDRGLSWTQHEPRMSLSLIGEACPAGRVIDVGGGSSFLSERLLDRGYSVTVLDISRTAIDRARKHLGARASQIHFHRTGCLSLSHFDDGASHAPRITVGIEMSA